MSNKPTNEARETGAVISEMQMNLAAISANRLRLRRVSQALVAGQFDPPDTIEATSPTGALTPADAQRIASLAGLTQEMYERMQHATLRDVDLVLQRQEAMSRFNAKLAREQAQPTDHVSPSKQIFDVTDVTDVTDSNAQAKAAPTPSKQENGEPIQRHESSE